MKKLIMLVLALGACVTISACNFLPGGSSSSSSSATEESSSESSSGTEDSSLESSSQEPEETLTVTFKQSGCDDIVKTVEKGETLTEIPTVQEKTGYTVVWDTTDFTNITTNIIVNALLTANTYTITYDANGGTVTPASQEVTFDEETTLAIPTKEDYVFAGWTYEDETVESGAAWTIADDVTLIAAWTDARPTYTVTFVDGTQTTEVEVKKGEDVATEDVPQLIGKTGYSVVWDITDYTNILADTTITAVYTANTYTVTYDANGGAVAEPSQEVEFDSDYTLLTPTHENSYMSFSGWQTEDETIVALTGTWSIARNIELTAIWTNTRETYTVSFVQEGQQTQTYTVLSGESLTTIPTPVAKTGYNVEWNVKDFTNITSNITVTAVETAKTYTITFNTNGGALADNTPVTVTYGQEYTIEKPTHDEYAFKAWKYNGETIALSGIWLLDIKGGELELIAEWGESNWTKNY